MLKAGSLFSGIEGLGLGLASSGLCESIWLSEIDPGACKVLARQYPQLPNHGDITKIDWTQVEPVDVLHGGFPCQDISKAGRGAGIKEGTRSGLWFEYLRAIRVLRPRIIVIENVATLLVRGLDVVLGGLFDCGYDAEWTTLRASDVGAPHRRERVFLVAVASDRDDERHVHPQPGIQSALGGVHALGYAATSGDRTSPDRVGTGAGRDAGAVPRAPEEARRQGVEVRTAGNGGEEPSADTDGKGPQGNGSTQGRKLTAWGGSWGEFEPAIRRWERVLKRPAPNPVKDGRLSADFTEWHMGFLEGWTEGLSYAERIKVLGNAVVPQCAELVGVWASQVLRDGVTP